MTQIERQSGPDDRPLPANRAFVVQFRLVTDAGKDIFQGRIEHLASGKADYFSNERELHDLIGELLPFERD